MNKLQSDSNFNKTSVGEANSIVSESLAESTVSSTFTDTVVQIESMLPPPSASSTDSATEPSTLADIPYQPSMEDSVDDERTLEDEEKLAEEDDGELDELAKLGEMPIEELLKLYGAPPVEAAGPSHEDSSLIESSESHSSAEKEHGEASDAPQASGNDEGDWTSSSEEDEGEEIDEETKRNEQLKLLKFLAQIGQQPEGSQGSDDSSSDDEEFIPMHLLLLKRETPIEIGRAHV